MVRLALDSLPTIFRMIRPQVMAFLQDIKENPADDTPRLVLADWLEENGNACDIARAELIRVQCRLAQLPADDPARAALEMREKDLVTGYSEVWLGPLADVPCSPTWKRGLGRIELAASRFLDRTHRGVHFQEGMARTEEYAFLGSLALTEWQEGDLVALLASNRLLNFTALRLVACNLGPDGAALLARSPRIAHLRELEIGDNQIGPQGMRALAESDNLPHLEALNLWANALDVEGTTILAHSSLLQQLRWLSVAYNALGPEGMAVLAPHIGHLGHLELWSNDIGRDGLVALLDSPLMPRLRKLDLPWNDLRNDGAELLGESPQVAEVRELFLFCNQIEDEGVEALAGSRHLARLETLDLDANRISDRGAWALARSPYLQHIRLLSLAKNDVGPTTRQALEQRFGDRVTIADG